MKNPIKIAIGLVLLTLLAGCVVTSVYPFYTSKDVVFDPALVGAWVEAGSTNTDSELWRFEKAGRQAYKLTFQENGKQTEYDSYLFKLKGRLFLDLCSREKPDNSLALHYLLKITRLDSALEMNLLEYDWLKKLIEKDPKAIRHIIVPKKLGEEGEGDLVLTAETAELQKFILKHEKTEGAFGKTSILNRTRH